MSDSAGFKRTKLLLIVVLIFYLFTVLWFTVLCRRPGEQKIQLELFWSYRLWFSGNWGFGWEILGNIAMFGPFGFMVGELLCERPVRRIGAAFALTVVSGFLFSGLIEGLQYVLCRGLFEWDDFVSNTLGAALGFGAWRLLRQKLPPSLREKSFLAIHLAFAVVCLGVLLFYRYP